MGGATIASTLGYSMLCNPFLAEDNEIPNRESVPACAAPEKSTGVSKQILRVAGYEEMTAANCNQFRKTACAAWRGHTDVEIDLALTTLIDCAGLGALIAVRNLAQASKGVARLINPTASVRQMLDLTRMGPLFDIVNTPDADLVFGPAVHN